MHINNIIIIIGMKITFTTKSHLKVVNSYKNVIFQQFNVHYGEKKNSPGLILYGVYLLRVGVIFMYIRIIVT